MSETKSKNAAAKKAAKPEQPPAAPPVPGAKDRAMKPGMVTCRVLGPGPMMTEEGVKTKGETFECSSTRAAAYGKLVVEADPSTSSGQDSAS